MTDLFDLDALERRATVALTNTYGPISGTAAFWAQKGIEAMRFAVAEAKEAQADEPDGLG